MAESPRYVIRPAESGGVKVDEIFDNLARRTVAAFYVTPQESAALHRQAEDFTAALNARYVEEVAAAEARREILQHLKDLPDEAVRSLADGLKRGGVLMARVRS